MFKSIEEEGGIKVKGKGKIHLYGATIAARAASAALSSQSRRIAWAAAQARGHGLWPVAVRSSSLPF